LTLCRLGAEAGKTFFHRPKTRQNETGRIAQIFRPRKSEEITDLVANISMSLLHYFWNTPKDFFDNHPTAT
jgi:hypothetical protein